MEASQPSMPASAVPAPSGSITKQEFVRLFLEKWVPSLITAVVAGIVAALLVPSITAGYTQATSFQSRQLNLWEKLSLDFTAYLNSREQLLTYVLNEPGQ